MPYLYLVLAIILEVIGSASLKSSEGFTKLLPTISTITAFLLCFFFLSKTIQNLPLNVAYATWAGLGLILTTAVSAIIFKEEVNLISIISISLIVVGVILLNTFGATH